MDSCLSQVHKYKVKCKLPCPGLELWLPCSFSMTITVTPCVCLCIYIYIYIYCDEEIWHPNTFPGLWWKEVGHAGYQTTIVVSRIGSERPSLSPTLSLQGDVAVGGPHSLLAMRVSAEKQTFNHIWYLGGNRQRKNQHMVIFQTTEIS